MTAIEIKLEAFFFNIVSSNTLNHNPTCGLIVKIFFKSDFQRPGMVGLYDLFQKSSQHFPPLSFRRFAPWPTPRAERGRNGAMDEAQAVLKATDDEAKRICQEIRRIGGTDRALELFWRDGP